MRVYVLALAVSLAVLLGGFVLVQTTEANAAEVCRIQAPWGARAFIDRAIPEINECKVGKLILLRTDNAAGLAPFICNYDKQIVIHRNNVSGYDHMSCVRNDEKLTWDTYTGTSSTPH